jgi:hypothetical protein
VTVKEIVFSGHAETKFEILREHGFAVSRKEVLSAVRNPDKVEYGYKERRIAQMNLSATHVIRVIYEEGQAATKVITFYPGRRDRYED